MSGCIVILATGTRGDTQPCVALGRELLRRGHRVRIAASARFAELVTGAGLEHAPVAVDHEEIFKDPDGKTWLDGGGPVAFLLGYKRVFEATAPRMLAGMKDACADAQVILGPSPPTYGYDLSEYYGVPCAFIHLAPGEPTRAFPNPLASPDRMLPRWVNRGTYALVEQPGWQILRPFVNRWRRDSLGLPPIPLSGPWRPARRRRLPVLCGFSPAVVPRPPDWPDYVHVTGYWHLDRPPGWAPPPVLADFLAAGPPPVYVGFGSMIPRAPAEVNRIVRAALRQAGVRGVLQGKPGEPGVEQDDDVLVVEGDIPHDWLFERCAAVVHHGGAGTTGTALRAGMPSMACPFFFDQPFWGARVAALGAGPAPLPIKELTAEALAEAIGRAATDPGMRDAAAAVGRKLRAERGAERACEVIEDLLRDPVPPGRHLGTPHSQGSR